MVNFLPSSSSPTTTSSSPEQKKGNQARWSRNHVQRAHLPPRFLPHRLPPRHLQLRPLALLFLAPNPSSRLPSSLRRSISLPSSFLNAARRLVRSSPPMHLRQQHHRAEMVAPKGCVTVRVGAEGEEQRRFAVPLDHVKHPLFAALLDEAEREYGFRHQGAIAIPCRVDRFVHVEHLIDRDLGAHHHQLVDLDCGATTAHGHGHLHLPRFVGCFRA